MDNEKVDNEKNTDIEEIVIAGAGPAGLMLACELNLAGVRPLVLERLTEPSEQPKANGLVGQVVRLFDHRGLFQRIIGADRPRPASGYMFGALPLDMTGIEDNPLFMLPVPQRRLEGFLRERAGELGVRVRNGHELTALTLDETGATVEVLGPQGTYEIRTQFVVGCDGAHSEVRKQAGIVFPGVVREGSVSRSAHVSLPGSLVVPETGELDVPGFGRIPNAQYVRTDNGVFVYAALEPGKPQVTTIEWNDGPGEVPSPGDDVPMSIDELRQSARRVLGVDVPLAPPVSPGPHLLRRLSGGNTRIAERYRDGRVFLAGDAAHVHSAIGGPGLNLGLQDAVNLGWKLAAQVHGWAPPGLLDTYHSERYPAGERVTMHTQAQTALIAPGSQVTALRELFGELLREEHTARHLARTLAGADIRYPMGTGEPHELTGRFAPDLLLDNGSTRLAELLREARPVLLDLSGDPEPAALAAGWKDRVDVLSARTPSPPADAMLIRPDGYVAWAGTGIHSGLEEALTAWFGRPVA
jgi:2-polyprenyl-6-methoxyphenol hydroxylase-like FAD-dependent oxidoreductase